MADRTILSPNRPRPYMSAPRPPARSEMNYRDGRPHVELYEVLEALDEWIDDPDDPRDPSIKTRVVK